MGKGPIVELAPGVWRIPLIGDYTNGFLLRDDDGQVTLLDMGLRFSGPKVMAALRSVGSDPSEVTRLLLTHCHPDHAGGAAHVQRETGRPVDVHADDAEYVRTGR
jgi:glyoxylase-like metal-dependent hydrolase (beta-lactamase superfamily II)